MPAKKAVAPAEPEARAQLAARALDERAAELAEGAPMPTGPGKPAGAGGESPEVPGAQPRDIEADKASFAAVLEAAIHGGARIVAAKLPNFALTVGTLILPKLPGFAQSQAETFGPALGLRFPRALPALGGICAPLVWWLRQLPPPRPPAPRPVEERTPEPQPPPDDAFAKVQP